MYGNDSSGSQADLKLPMLLLLLVTPALFATNVVIGRYAVDHVGPWTLAFLRWLGALLLFTPFCLQLSRVDWKQGLQQWRLFLIAGSMGIGLCGGGYYWSLQHTTATNGALIYSPSPALMVLFEALLLRQWLSRRVIAGLLSALLGVLLIISKGDISTLKQLSFNIGDLGVLACAVGWAIYSLSLRRPELLKLPTQIVFMGTMLGGLLCLLPFVFWEEWQAYALPTTAAGWWSVAGLSLIPSVLAFMAFQTGIRKVGAARTAIFLYLMPFYAVLMSMLLLGEATAWYHWVGFACVLLGIGLASGLSKSNVNA